MATLVVVMVLFFIVSLMAAYTSRNMIFEQKTSANTQRAGQAFEAAEAGLEWALAMLNRGAIDDDCAEQAPPASSATFKTFRDRYLTLEPVEGKVQLTDSTREGNRFATCVYNGSAWQCKCPDASGLDPAAPTGSSGFPAFRVAVRTTPRPVIFEIVVQACTRLDLGPGGCLDTTNPNVTTNDSQTTVRAWATLRSGLVTPPAAALTLRGELTRSSAPSVVLVNTDLDSAGITLHAGGAIDPVTRGNLQLNGPPGTPEDKTLAVEDSRLSVLMLTDPDRMFVSTFGMARITSANAPGTLQAAPGNGPLVCASGPCTAADVNRTLATHPYRTLWIADDLVLDVDVGTATAPALLVVSGSVSFGDGVELVGLLYLSPPLTPFKARVTTASGSAGITGGLVGESDVELEGAGTLRIAYDRAVLTRLRTQHGSIVRVPGSWRDFGEVPLTVPVP